MIVAAYEHTTGRKWYRLRCPACYWSHNITLWETDNMVQCPYCRKYFGRYELCMMFPHIGGLRELTEREAQRAQQRRYADALREVAGDIDRELKDRHQSKSAARLAGFRAGESPQLAGFGGQG